MKTESTFAQIAARKTDYDGQTEEQMTAWIEANPTQIDGVMGRLRMIKEMYDNPYGHYYGYRKAID